VQGPIHYQITGSACVLALQVLLCACSASCSQLTVTLWQLSLLKEWLLVKVLGRAGSLCSALVRVETGLSRRVDLVSS
jgi:hypothetical protein